MLWRWAPVRWVVIRLMERNLAPDWMVYRSGVMVGLRDLFLREGDFAGAARCAEWLGLYERR